MRSILFAGLALAIALVPVQAPAEDYSSFGSPVDHRGIMQRLNDNRQGQPDLTAAMPERSYEPIGVLALPPIDPMGALAPPVYANPYPGEPFWTMPLTDY